MVELQDIPEILQAHTDRVHSKRDVLEILLDVVEQGDIDEVMAALPDPWSKELGQLMRDQFDNDTPADQFLWVKSYCGLGEPSEPHRAALVNKIRAWLRRDGY